MTFPRIGLIPSRQHLAKAIDGIAASADYAADYATFRRDMVYGGGVDFETAVGTLKELGEYLRKVGA